MKFLEDRINCFVQIRMGTYKYYDDQLRLRYAPRLSGMYSNQSTANFIFNDFDLSKDYSWIDAPYMGDIFREHVITIRMARKYHIYLLTIYLPASTLAVLRLETGTCCQFLELSTCTRDVCKRTRRSDQDLPG